MASIIRQIGLILMVLILSACAANLPQRVEVREDVLKIAREMTAAEQPGDLPELRDESGLNDYLAYAALNNPGLKAAFLRWKAALEKIPQVTALPDPRFTYAYYIKSVETRVGPQHHRFALLQTFPWYGKLELRGDTAAESARADQQRYEAAKLTLFYQVKDAYYEYYFLGKSIAATEENMELMQQLESIARTQYATGLTPYASVVRAQVELGKIEDRMKTLQDLREPIAAKLNAALNRQGLAPLPWPKQIREEDASFTEEQLLTWLKESNPDLKALDFMAEKEKKNIDLARKDFYPDLTLGIESIYTGGALMPGTPDSGKDPLIASLSFNFPIWWGKYRAGEREALTRYASYRIERIDQENRLWSDLKLAAYEYRDAERKISLYRDTLLPKAAQSIQVSLESFENGLGSFFELIDSVRTLLEFQLAYERALAEKAQRLAELEMIVGKQVPRTTEKAQQENSTEPLQK